MASATAFYRCAGPNCGLIKKPSDRWWLMWTSLGAYNRATLSLCRWDEEIARHEGALSVCGEQCMQRLQSQFTGNVTQGEFLKSGTEDR